RLRLANGSIAWIASLRFEGPPAWIVAIDGQPAARPFQPKSDMVVLTPGGRIDLIVDMPQGGAATFQISAQIAPEVRAPLFRLKAEGRAVPLLGEVRPLPPNGLPDRIDLARSSRADLRLLGGPTPDGKFAPWRIERKDRKQENGRLFS